MFFSFLFFRSFTLFSNSPHSFPFPFFFVLYPDQSPFFFSDFYLISKPNLFVSVLFPFCALNWSNSFLFFLSFTLFSTRSIHLHFTSISLPPYALPWSISFPSCPLPYPRIYLIHLHPFPFLRSSLIKFVSRDLSLLFNAESSISFFHFLPYLITVRKKFKKKAGEIFCWCLFS